MSAQIFHFRHREDTVVFRRQKTISMVSDLNLQSTPFASAARYVQSAPNLQHAELGAPTILNSIIACLPCREQQVAGILNR